MASVNIIVRPADLERDASLLIAEIQTHLNPLCDQRRFDWLYVQNPHGRARVWIAEDRDSGQVVGTCAALPRYFYVHGQELLGCVFADFWVHAGYRSLGPALQLQRACLESVRSGDFALAYDYPRKGMVAVHKRLGIEVQDNLIRYTKLLRFDECLEKRIPVPWVVRMLARIGNPVLPLLERRLPNADGYTVAKEESRCTGEFTELAVRVSERHGVCVFRSAEYLNWRYHDHFHQCHEFVVARRGNGQLAGYAVFVDHGRNGQIVDLFGDDDPALISALLHGVATLLRSRGRYSVSISVLASDRRSSTVQHMYFAARGSDPLIIYWGTGRAGSSQSESREVYFFMYGDEAD